MRSGVHALFRTFAARREVLLLAPVLLLHSLLWNYTVDDAYISFRYAENLLAGRGLVYNAGERVEGYTNFLWVLLVAGPMALKVAPVVASKVLGLAAASVLLTLVALDIGKEKGRAIGFGAALLFALDPAFALWTTAGLETPLFLLFAYLALRPALAGERALPASAGAWAALAGLTRPEGYVVFAIVAVVAAARGAIANSLRALAVFALLVAPHLAFKAFYYGDIFPNTYYAKVGGVLAWGRGARYLGDWLLRYGAAPLALIALAGAVALARRRSPRLVPIALTAGAFGAYVCAVGGDGLTMFRFALFVLVPLAILAAEGAAFIAERIRPSARNAVLAFLFAAAVVFPARNSFAGPYHAFAVDDRNRVLLHWVEIGKWLSRHSLPNDAVAVGVAGAIPYYGKITAIDMLGITDRHIAHAPSAAIGSGIAGHERHDMQYVLERKPEFIIHYPFLVPSPDSAFTVNQFKTEWNPGLADLLKSPEFDKGYRGEIAEVRIGKERLMYLPFFRRRPELKRAAQGTVVQRP